MGVLPEGFKSQRTNRDETIINQEGAYFMEAIRGGAVALDGLTNYVQWVGITNVITNANPVVENYMTPADWRYWYGSNIIGMLTTPKNLDMSGVTPGMGYLTVAAKVKAISGSVSERYLRSPEFQFCYLLRSEVIPYTNIPPAARSAILASNPKDSVQDRMDKTNAWSQSLHLQNNLYEVRLTLNWPVRPNGSVGSGQKVFRTLVSGPLRPVANVAAGKMTNLFFFKPSHYGS